MRLNRINRDRKNARSSKHVQWRMIASACLETLEDRRLLSAIVWTDQLSAFVPHQTIAIRPKPQHAVSVFVNCTNKPFRTASLGVVADKPAVFELRRSLKRARPQISVAVKVDGDHVIARQAVVGGVMRDFLVVLVFE